MPAFSTDTTRTAIKESIAVKRIDSIASNLTTVTTSIKKLDLDETSSVEFVDTGAGVVDFLESIHDMLTSPPFLYVDLEGINLSRRGSISILQIYVPPTKRTYLIDIHTLKEKAFSVPDSHYTTLKEILESKEIIKVFFDVRNDSDALFAHYGVDLAGIHDLQLMELATRLYSKEFVTGLAKCIEKEAPMTSSERRTWSQVKESGKRLFAPELGGSYQVFNMRPLPEKVKQYCVQDVQFLPKLWKLYNNRMTPRVRDWVLRESAKRVVLSQSPTYTGQGKGQAIAPAFLP